MSHCPRPHGAKERLVTPRDGEPCSTVILGHTRCLISAKRGTPAAYSVALSFYRDPAKKTIHLELLRLTNANTKRSIENVATALKNCGYVVFIDVHAKPPDRRTGQEKCLLCSGTDTYPSLSLCVRVCVWVFGCDSAPRCVVRARRLEDGGGRCGVPLAAAL